MKFFENMDSTNKTACVGIICITIIAVIGLLIAAWHG